MPKNNDQIEQGVTAKKPVKTPSKTDKTANAKPKAATATTAKTPKKTTPRKPREKKPLPPKKLKLLVTIVNRNKAEFYMDLLQSFEINAQLALSAQGTATSETRKLLGLDDSSRVVILSFIREDMSKKALAVLEEKFSTIRGGKGIAYTIPLSSVIGVAIYQFLSNNRIQKEDKK